MKREIQIRGARQHNLDALDLNLPAEQLVVITGVSGSGKSSLAFDTIHREGQRRFLRSFSAHARQYLGRLERPAVEAITGLTPTVCLEQRRLGANARSTVGTLSELADHLRLLYARSGRAPCPACGGEVDGVRDGVGARRVCPGCGHDHRAPESSCFSFNTPSGACPDCQGLGEEDWVDPELLVAHPDKSLRAGALVPTTPTGYIVYSQVTIDVLDEVCRAHGFNVDIPWQELTDEQRDVVFYGSDRVEVPFGKHPLESRLRWSGITARPRETGHYKGLVPTIADIVRRNRNKNAMRFARSRPCAACRGTRLGPAALAVTYCDRSIADLSGLAVGQLADFFEAAPPAGTEAVVTPLVERIRGRLSILSELGLDHLSLDRPSGSLSAGEAQRVRLATLVGGGLTSVCYVLDEPSVGLHGQDTHRLLRLLARLRDGGNSVLVVEHDQRVMRAADWLVDIGPGAGSDGGKLLYSGPPERLADPAIAPAGTEHSATRRFLTGETRVAPARSVRPGTGVLEVRGARQHNLQNVTAAFHLGALNLVTGVSGSGKSTLVMHVLARSVRQRLHGGRQRAGDHDEIVGAEHIDKVVQIDQAPIGRTPRSNPATYTKLFDRVRAIFAATDAARALGFGKGRFSFNNKGGRCEACQGAGVQTVGMHFLGDVAVRCEQCAGRRFNDETLQIRVQGLSVHDVLALSVAQARALFAGDKVLARMLGALEELGLGYVALGQPSTTLSGGEAQRVKLAAELARPATGRTLYLLDEPTTGLHDQDLTHLVSALQRLVDRGNTVIAIEHHPDLIHGADRVVDLGPGAGVHGGRVVAQGTPEQVAAEPGSVTGQLLCGDGDPGAFGGSGVAPVGEPGDPAPDEIRLAAVCTHNLQSVDVTIPTRALTVITGVSGSGKSSLAFDTLYAEGQRRFTETLSPYARRHMEQLPRPSLESASGLTPTVGISRRTLAPNPRSTVGTLTELYDLYRLVFARAGTPHCPGCDEPLVEGACPGCGQVAPGPLTASRFSFNHHLGSCPRCRGLGTVKSADPDKLVTDPTRALTAGALDGHKTGRFYGEPDGQYVAILREVGQVRGLDFDRAWQALSDDARQVAMFGTGDTVYDVLWRYDRKGRAGEHRFERPWPGFVALVDEEYGRKHADRRGDAMEAVLTEQPCAACGGERLEPLARAVRFGGKRIGPLCGLTVDQARGWFSALGADSDPRSPTLSSREAEVTADARRAIDETLAVIADVGLGYLSADRRAASLSGGEARRLQLATLVGSDLSGVTYVLDEPTIGLHSTDTRGLVRTLEQLRDRDNTVVVVEHDPEVIRTADHVIELGPGAGARGGRIVAQGSVSDIEAADTPTGRMLSSHGHNALSGTRRTLTDGVHIQGAHAHNLADLDLHLPAGGLVVLSGVSGSGKTTLLHDVVGASAAAGQPMGCRSLTGLEGFGRVVRVDPSPLGASPGSNPATYTGLFDRVRDLFAGTDDARQVGFKKSRFSFHGKAGQCPRCKGLGSLRTPMGFLADVWVTCDACHGDRFNAETLTVRWQDHDLAQVLRLSVDEAAALFAADRRLATGLALLQEVGLGYLQLGQPATTLSGGESQRVKLVAELLRKEAPRKKGDPPRGPSLYLLDEPTVGLHGDDVNTLLALLNRLCDAGHSVCVVEHHQAVIRAADWIVDLGPGGGPAGGYLVAEGTPAQVAAVTASLTGRALSE